MKVAIIGGGITGLTAAFQLTQWGHTVTVYEKDKELGGLAGGFYSDSWTWPLEKTYHHFFTNDKDLISLAQELGIEKDLMILSPTTSIYWNNAQYPFDSPMNILKFPGIPFADRVRTGITAAIMKINPFWQPLEHLTAKHVFQTLNGAKTWKTIWEPLLDAKFNSYANDIAASWLWGRLHKRTSRLGYIRGGFSHLVKTLEKTIKKQGGKILTKTPVASVTKQKNIFLIHNNLYNAVLFTTPSAVVVKSMNFPATYTQQLLSIDHLWAQVLILETDKPLLHKTYWLNINDRSFPFLAVVQHTNMIDPKWYGNHHLTYIGNYLPDHHPLLSQTKEQLYKTFLPGLKKLIPTIHSIRRINTYSFTAPFAQPVHTRNYSKRAPTIQTPIPHVYIANLDSIFPWDRGTNYAVKLGIRAAKTITSFDNI